MTNEEMAELLSVVACVQWGFDRLPRAGLAERVRYGLKYREQIRVEVLEQLELDRPTESVSEMNEPSPRPLSELIREHLGEKAKRQYTIEEELRLEPGLLDGVLTEANGFTVNAQGWVRVAEAVPV